MILKFLRKKTRIIIWIIVIAFIAWGGFAVGVQFQQGNRSPGKIFGKEVSFQEYWLANRAVQIFSPAREEKEPPSAEQIEARTWEFLILSQEGRRQKIAVTDEEVRQEIARLLGEQEKEGLAQDQYLRWVRSTLREEPREFEKQVREHLRIRKLLEQVQQGVPENQEESLKRWLLELFARAKIEVYKPRS